MKRFVVILILSLMCAGSASAQHYIGIKGGTGFSSGRFYPKREQNMISGVHNAALAWKYYNSYQYTSGVNKYMGVIAAEAELMQRGFEYLVETRNGSVIDTTYYRRKVNTLAVPIMCQLHISFGRNNGVRVFLNAGFVVTYNLSSTEYLYSHDRQLISSGNYEMQLLRDKRLGYGLTGGPGVNVIFGRWELTVEARYFFDLGDILRTRNDFPSNPFIRSQVDKISFYMGFYYRLGSAEKYGIKPRAAKNARRGGSKTDGNGTVVQEPPAM